MNQNLNSTTYRLQQDMLHLLTYVFTINFYGAMNYSA